MMAKLKVAEDKLAKFRSDYNNFTSNLKSKANQVKTDFKNWVSDAGRKFSVSRQGSTVTATAPIPFSGGKKIQIQATAPTKQDLTRTLTESPGKLATMMRTTGDKIADKMPGVGIVPSPIGIIKISPKKIIKTLSRGAANTQEMVGSGTADLIQSGANFYKNPWDLKNYAQTARGVGKILFAGNPVTTGAQLISGADESGPLGRISTGFIRGGAGINTLSPQTQERKIKLGPLEFDPLVTAGNVVGFIRNPVNKKLFDLTNTFLPSSGKNIIAWAASTALRGGVENIILSLPEMPDASPEDKANYLLNNAMVGAGTEILGQGLLQGAKATPKFTVKFLANVFDELKQLKTKLLNVEVKTPQVEQQLGIKPVEDSILNQTTTIPEPPAMQSLGQQTLDQQIKETAKELGIVRKALKTEMDIGARETLRNEEAFLRQEYARLKYPEGYTPQAKKAMDEASSRATKILQGSPKLKIKNPVAKLQTKLRSIFTPIKNLQDNLQVAMKQLVAGHNIALVDGNQTEMRFSEISRASKINPDIEWKLVQYSQEPTPAMAKLLELTPEQITSGQGLIKAHREFNDQIFNMAQKAGIDLNYLKNHALQIYQETGQEIVDRLKARGLSTKPGFANERIIDNYWRAVNEVGLTPKYTTFGQINAAMQEQLGKALANKAFLDAVKNSGKLKPSNKAPAEWVTITAPGFPSATVKIGKNKSITLPYKATPELAKVLNNYFGGQVQSDASKALETAGEASGIVQDIKMSGGVRTINAFSLSQIFKDISTSIGDIMTLHPAKGARRLGNTTMAMLRDFIPGASTRFEQANKEEIRQMASQGIGYGGDANFKFTRKNVAEMDNVLVKALKTGKNIWESITNNPTFQHMMWQRRIGQFKIYRDEFLKSGKTMDEAVQMAAKELNAYDGVADSIGRSQDVENLLKLFFFASKYREAVIGSQVNIIKGLWNFNDKTYASSRSLGVGLIATYLMYNKLNEYYNDGKGLNENPKGKELSLVIPKNKLDPSANPNEYWHFPWMPGYTATARNAILGTNALLHGDTKEAGKQFSGFGATWVQTAKELSSGEDYFGRELFDPNKPRLPQQISHGITSSAPGPVREAIEFSKDTAAGKDPNAALAIARGLELPIKEGKFSSQFYNIRDNALGGQDNATKDGYDFLHPTKEAWEMTSAVDQSPSSSNEQDRMTKANIRLQNPNIFMVEKEIAVATAKKLGKDVDPLYTVPMETAMRYLRYQSLPIGNGDKKALGKLYPEIFELAEKRSEFFKANPIPGSDGPNRPIPSERAQKLMDEGNWTDSEVQAYLRANEIYKNQEREKLGLPPVSSGYGGFGFPEKKLKIKTTSKPPKRASLKLGPTSKIKLSTPKIEPPKMPNVTIKALRDGYSGYQPAKIKVAYKKMPLTIRSIGNG